MNAIILCRGIAATTLAVFIAVSLLIENPFFPSLAFVPSCSVLLSCLITEHRLTRLQGADLHSRLGRLRRIALVAWPSTTIAVAVVAAYAAFALSNLDVAWRKSGLVFVGISLTFWTPVFIGAIMDAVVALGTGRWSSEACRLRLYGWTATIVGLHFGLTTILAGHAFVGEEALPYVRAYIGGLVPFGAAVICFNTIRLFRAGSPKIRE